MIPPVDCRRICIARDLAYIFMGARLPGKGVFGILALCK
jgi:hypothetical protein